MELTTKQGKTVTNNLRAMIKQFHVKHTQLQQRLSSEQFWLNSICPYFQFVSPSQVMANV